MYIKSHKGIYRKNLLHTNHKMKNTTTIALFALSIIVLTSFSSAVFWACFENRQAIDYCNPLTPDRTCDQKSGCVYCMSSYNSTKGCYNQGSLNACNSVTYECAGGNSTPGNTTFDLTPPVITLLSPQNNQIYSSMSITLNINTNEFSDISFADISDFRGSWTQICNDCASYNKLKSFKEGLNNLTFRAIDPAGNIAYKNISFIVDSKKPKITKTEPKSGLSTGLFEIWFTERNPTDLKINYGNILTGYKTSSLNIQSDCTRDVRSSEKYYCSKQLDIKSYDSQEITYNLTINDIANSQYTTKSVKIKVDTTAPVINSLNYTVNKLKATFKLNITEVNPEKVYYIDNSDSSPKWKTLCSSLKNWICEKPITFRTSGVHIVDIQVDDKAGNSVSQRVSVVI